MKDYLNIVVFAHSLQLIHVLYPKSLTIFVQFTCIHYGTVLCSVMYILF